MDEDQGGVSGRWATTEDDQSAVLLGGFRERRPTACTPAVLLFEQRDAMEVRCLPDQTVLPADFPVFVQGGVERTGVAPDLDEPGNAGRIVVRELRRTGA